MNTKLLKLFGLIAMAAIFASFPTFYPNLSRADWNYITLSSYYLFPGQKVRVLGDGFSPNESISISVAGTVKNIGADQQGKFSSPQFTISYQAIGQTIEVSARGNAGHYSTANLVVGTYYPHVTPSSYYVTQGSSISFIGKHFAPNELVTIQSEGVILATKSTDSAGTFNAGPIKVPYKKNSVSYSFTGVSSRTTDTTVIHISATPAVVTLNNYYEQPGKQIEVEGRFFGSGEEVNLKWGDISLGTAVTTPDGLFKIAVTVPKTTPLLQQNIIATGNLTDMAGQAIFTPRHPSLAR